VASINGEFGSLSGCGINLCGTELGDWLEIDMNGVFGFRRSDLEN